MNRIRTGPGIIDASKAALARRRTVKIVLAFVAIYVIWGTTYLAMAIAVKTLPPFSIAGWRFLAAGAGLFAVMTYRGVARPTAVQWRSAAVVGCFLMVGGNGCVIWAVQKIPSGICTVVVATMPLWMTLFDWLFYGGPRINLKVATGLLLGLCGIVLLIGPSELMAGETTLHLPSMLALMCAPIFWSIGSLQSRTMDLPPNVFMATAAEMLCGGAALVILSLIAGEPFRLDIAQVSWQSATAVVYLTIFGSIIALSSYMWLLKNALASRVSTYTYINPLIAVYLGWLILDEPITLQTIAATAIIVSAVVMIVSMRQNRRS